MHCSQEHQIILLARPMGPHGCLDLTTVGRVASIAVVVCRSCITVPVPVSV